MTGKAIPDRIRNKAERRLATELTKVEKKFKRRLIRLLGHPPDQGKVPIEFWSDYARETNRVLTTELQDTMLGEMQRYVNLGPVAPDWDDLVGDANRWSMDYTTQISRGIADNSQRIVGDIVRDARESGQSQAELAKRLTWRFGRAHAEMVAITETTRADAEAATALQNRLGEMDVRTQRRWLTGEDAKVCPLCVPFDHATADIGQPFTATNGQQAMNPPLHPRCRCQVVIEEIPPEEVPTGPVPTERKPFVPAKTTDEVATRIAPYVDHYELNELPLAQQNSILKAAEETLGRHNITIDSLGYQTRRTKSYGRALYAGKGRVEIQKTFLKSPAKKAQETRRLFANKRAAEIAYRQKSIADPARVALVERNQAKLSHWESMERWTVFQDADDPLEAVTQHEFFHIIDYQSRPNYLSHTLKSKVVDAGIDWYPSEYSTASPSEYWTETASAINMGLDVPAPVVSIFEEVIGGAK